ncbi:DNA damage-regulated autophagy modulator protein [Tyrophagus putrescentiae]|nr:DNA damage-regulated autophagy modulator protein [Tyrophagus putrescentiae]
MASIIVIFPILLALFMWFMIISCYIQGYLRNHYEAVFPVVSDSGNYIPEAATFSWTIVVVGSLFLIIAAIRYLQLRAIINDEHFVRIITTYYGSTADIEYYRKRFNSLNWWALIGGVLMGYSSMATGCFRFADSFLGHNASASGIFFITPLYMLVNTYFGAVLKDFVNTRTSFYLRFLITWWAITLAVVFITTEFYIMGFYHSYSVNPVKRLFWTKKDPGFILHVVNSATEWAYLMLLSPYVYTFVEEMSRLSFVGVQCQFEFIDAEEENENEEKGMENDVNVA